MKIGGSETPIVDVKRGSVPGLISGEHSLLPNRLSSRGGGRAIQGSKKVDLCQSSIGETNGESVPRRLCKGRGGFQSARDNACQS